MADFDRESMMEMFTFEMNQLLEQLEQNIIQGESGYSSDQINEIFRIMHTIKGSAAMMLFNSIATAAHTIEDLFYYLREENPSNVDFSRLTDLVLEGVDFIKEELAKIERGEKADGDNAATNVKIEAFLANLKGGGAKQTAAHPASPQKQAHDTPVTPTAGDTGKSGEVRFYKARIRFEDGCEMENIRAFTLINNLKPVASDISHTPADVIDEGSIETIREDGFSVMFSSTLTYDETYEHLFQTIYIAQLVLEEMDSDGNYVLRNAKTYDISVRFEPNGEPENERAKSLLFNLRNRLEFIKPNPENLSGPDSARAIRDYGFVLELVTAKSFDELSGIFGELIPLHDISIEERVIDKSMKPLETEKPDIAYSINEPVPQAAAQTTVDTPVSDNDNGSANLPAQQDQTGGAQSAKKTTTSQSVISVSVNKLDQLVKLIGEIVIAEAMVTQHPDLEGLKLDDFHKEARQLRIILKDLQETIMSMRVVPISSTFFRMNRIVRDMCKQLNKEVQLDIVGEETEVDKNIIEHITDPIMHIIRNAVDHGIESPSMRASRGKNEKGRILLEAKNSGSDILVIIKDDGEGLNRDAILAKARNNGLLTKPDSEYSDKEIHQFIFMPGFSTNEQVTSYSGRGVGMDVVSKNLELVNGSVIVNSVPGEGSTFTLKIPSTLAIIDGMVVKMGGAKYIIPIMHIKDTFRPKMKDVFFDPNGNEMITVYNEVYNVVRLHEVFGMHTDVTNLEDGILIMLENGDNFICLLIDDLISEQPIVVKPIPKYIKKARGISGCTLLGNGEISLIIDAAGFFDR